MTQKHSQSKSTPQEDDGTQVRLAELQSQINDLTSALQRERADAVNLRRRHDEQYAQLKNVVKANVVRELLPVIDNFERALKYTPPSLARHAELDSASKDEIKEILKQVQDDAKKFDDFVKGVQGVVKQFEKTLADIGVEKIKTVGEPFDPKYHEAVSMEDGDGSTETVSEELQSGYRIGEDVIRHAMVKVRMQ